MSLFIGFILYNTIIFTAAMSNNHVEIDISNRSIFDIFPIFTAF